MKLTRDMVQQSHWVLLLPGFIASIGENKRKWKKDFFMGLSAFDVCVCVCVCVCV